MVNEFKLLKYTFKYLEQLSSMSDGIFIALSQRYTLLQIRDSPTNTATTSLQSLN